MWLPDDPSKFTSRFKYVEFAKWAYSEKQGRWSVFRDTKFNGDGVPRTPLLYTWDEVRSKVDVKSEGFYTSTFAFNGRKLESAQSISSLYFDLDANEKKDQDVELALSDTRKLYNYISSVGIQDEAIRIYFSGKKGFHLEVEAVALGVGPASDLVETFRYIAESLRDDLDIQTIDFQCYDPRRMWRIPNTKNQGTGLYKVPLYPEELLSLSIDQIKEIATKPRSDYEVPAQEFKLAANEWFRSFSYKKLENQVSNEERVRRFMKNGSGLARKIVSDLDFDPMCFENCDALNRLWVKAETTHNLEHNERLFLCSLLTYSDEAIEYLHAILSNCTDYTPEKSQSHIDDWVKRREMGIGGRPFTCSKARASGVMCGGCDKLEAKEKYEVIGDRMVPTGEMAQPSPVRFCYRRSRQ